MKDFFRSTLRGERRRPKPADRELVVQRLNQDQDLRRDNDNGRAEIASGRFIRWN